jgi:hypothetical protein
MLTLKTSPVSPLIFNGNFLFLPFCVADEMREQIRQQSGLQVDDTGIGDQVRPTSNISGGILTFLGL